MPASFPARPPPRSSTKTDGMDGCRKTAAMPCSKNPTAAAHPMPPSPGPDRDDGPSPARSRPVRPKERTVPPGLPPAKTPSAGRTHPEINAQGPLGIAGDRRASQGDVSARRQPKRHLHEPPDPPRGKAATYRAQGIPVNAAESRSPRSSTRAASPKGSTTAVTNASDGRPSTRRIRPSGRLAGICASRPPVRSVSPRRCQTVRDELELGQPVSLFAAEHAVNAPLTGRRYATRRIGQKPGDRCPRRNDETVPTKAPGHPRDRSLAHLVSRAPRSRRMRTALEIRLARHDARVDARSPRFPCEPREPAGDRRSRALEIR